MMISLLHQPGCIPMVHNSIVQGLKCYVSFFYSIADVRVESSGIVTDVTKYHSAICIEMELFYRNVHLFLDDIGAFNTKNCCAKF